MNKTVLIAGGASLASLAAGGVAGYFLAKKKFDDELPSIIENETAAIKKFHAIQLMEARSGKPESPEDLVKQRETWDIHNEGFEEDEPEDSEKEEILTEADEQIIANVKSKLTDYNRISTTIARSEETSNGHVVTENIFSSGKAKNVRPVPPRGEGGKFVSRNATQQSEPEKTPYIITMEEYLQNEKEYEQKSLRYFRNDDTLIDVEDNDEPYEIVRVGEVNLTLFPEPDETGTSIICVRNEALQRDYEIQFMTESLTDYKGLGENEEELDPAAYL